VNVFPFFSEILRTTWQSRQVTSQRRFENLRKDAKKTKTLILKMPLSWYVTILRPLVHRFFTGVRRVVLGGPRRSHTSNSVPIYTSFKVIQWSTSSAYWHFRGPWNFFQFLGEGSTEPRRLRTTALVNLPTFYMCRQLKNLLEKSININCKQSRSSKSNLSLGSFRLQN